MWIQPKFRALPLVMLGLIATGCEVGSEEPSEGERSIPADDEGSEPPERCANIDEWETNDSFKQAYHVMWDNEGFYPDASVSAYLCPSEEDWYYFETDVGIEEQSFSLVLLVKNADHCECNGQTLPSGPENTVTIEAYRADTMELLTSRTSDHGNTGILEERNEDYTHNVLIRVFSPTKAEFPYNLIVSLFSGGAGDDCEC
jgi:hypothetical protein